MIVLRGEPARQSEDGRVFKYAVTKPPLDERYDRDAELKDKQDAERARQKNQQITYMKRLIVHPSFINATFAQVIKYMESQDQSEAIFRPSSKGVLRSFLVLILVLIPILMLVYRTRSCTLYRVLFVFRRLYEYIVCTHTREDMLLLSASWRLSAQVSRS